MGNPQRKIVVAAVFGVLLIVGAYISSRQQPAPLDVMLMQKVEREYVKPEDADENGVPDWQDALVGENSITTIEASSTFEKPTTVTGKFGLSFFENMIRSKMYGAFGDTQEELVAESLERLRAEAVDELFSEKDIILFETDDAMVLKMYGNQIATVLTSHPTQEESELYILQEYLRYEDPNRLEELEPIALAYTTIVKDLLEMQVPSKYTKEHLDLLNAVNAVREDVRGMQKVETDSLYTLLRAKRYPDDVLGMGNAIKNLFNKLYLESGIRWNDGEPVLKLMVFPQ